MSTPESHLPPFEDFEEFYVPGGHPAPPRTHFGPLAPRTIPDSSFWRCWSRTENPDFGVVVVVVMVVGVSHSEERPSA